MPIINVPGVGQVNFPDSMSDKEIVEAIERDILKTKKAKEVSLKETVADIPKALGRGAVGLLETAGIGASAALPEEYEEKARKGIESLAAPAREYLAPATPEIAETVPSKLAAGLGSTLPFFALGPAGIAGRAIAGGLGVSAGAGEARRGAELAGATAEDRRLATVLGAPTGLLDIIAPNIGPLKTMFTTALARGGVEGITEAAQNVAQNLIARGVYDPKRDVLEGTAEEGAYGAGVGALASLMVDMAFGRRAYAPKAAPEAAAPQGAPVSPVAAPEIATVAPPSGFSAEEAANLRAQAEEAEQARLAGIAEAEREQMAAAQEFARGMPGLTGAPGMNVQMMDAVRQRQAEEAAAAEAQRQAEAKQAEAQRQAQIKEIESTTFSADPVMDRLTKDRMLANLQVLPATVAGKGLLQTKPELNYFEQQDAIRRAEEADVRKGMRPLKEKATRLAPEELEQMGFPPKEKKPAKMKPAENPDNLGFMGFDQAGDPILDLVATGAKPFPKRSEAEQAKTFVPDTKIIKVPNGFVLSPKTDEDFAREAQAGRRLGRFQSGKEKGMPTAAHEFIIERGGLRKDQQRNTDFPDENPRVGNRVLFKPQGMTLAEAAEKLYEAGYIDEETETKAQDAISKSIKGNRVYTPEGYDRASEIERQKAEIAAARAEPPYLPEEDIYDRMYSDDFFRQPMEEVRRIAEENSLDFSGIAEEVYSRLPQDVTQAQYDDAVRQAVSGAIRNRPQSGSISETLAQEGGVKGNNPTKEGIAFQQQLQGKTFDQALDWMVANAPTRFNKLVAQKIKAVANALQQRGVQINFEIQGGDRRDSRLYAARGVTSFTWRDDGTSINILLNGEPVIKDQNGYASGMNYGTLQHEFLHVTTRSATRFLPANDPIKKELNDLFNKVVVEFNKQAKEGALPPLLKDYYRRLNNVLASPDELMSWGITDRDFQNWLDTINVGPKQTAFNKLVSLIRDLIGLSKPFETALERLVRATDSMLTMDVDVVGKAMERQGYSFGKPVAKPVGKMQQQELFRGSQRMARDTLAVRKGGFYFDAKDSPLYQTRTAEEVGDFSQAEADKVVDLDKRARDIQAERRWVGKLKDGAWIGARLDLGTYKAAKPRGLPPVLSLHEGKESLHTRAGFSKGELLKLVPHVTLKNVRFNVFQGERERIAAGGEKGRMASADGQYMDVPPNFDGIEVSFNPTREHLFRDALGRAVKYADEVTVLKNRMYARGNIEYYGAEDVPPVPTKPSDSWIMASGQDARRLQERPAIVDEGNKVSKEQQQNLFNGQNIIQDTLFSRRAGFFIDARQSPLYQRRNAGQVPVITQEMANRALATHSKGARVEGKGIQLKPGDYIGARLDLPIRASSRDIMPGGVPLQAIHMGNASNHARDNGGFWNGAIAKYLPSVTMKNVKFRVDQEAREEIAAGRKKAPMGSADGQFVRSDNPNFDGIELRFNPKREHLFIDAMGRAVKYADEVTVMGDRMYARGHVEYFGDEDFIGPAGPSPTGAKALTEEEAARQLEPGLLQAVQESAGTGKSLPPSIQESLFSINAPASQVDLFGKNLALAKFLKSSKEKGVLYHGTSQGDIRAFKAPERKRVPSGYMWGQKGDETYQRAIYVSPSPDFAGHFAKKGTKLAEQDAGQYAIYPVYVKAENPFDYENSKHRKMLERFFQKQYDDWHKEHPEVQRMPDVNMDVLVKDPKINFEQMESPEIQYAIQKLGFDSFYVLEGGVKNLGVYSPTQIKSAIGNVGTYSPEITDILAQAAGPRTQAGNDAMEILSGMGRFVEAPEPGYVAQVRQAWDNARDNPKLAKEQSLGTFRRWADQVETWALSSDAALNNQIRREIMNSMRGQEEKIGILLNASLSQTAHSDAVANLFLMKGNIEWDKELHKWKGVDDKNNAINLSAKLDEIAAKHGLTKEEIELIAHTAFEAKRTRSLIQFNQELEAKAEAMRAEAARVRDRSPVAASELSDKASRMLQDRKVIHMTPEEIQAGMTQFQLFPELNGVVDIWNGMRENALKVMTDTGLYSRTEAENLLANADYVPFYREDQIEEGKGPKEFLRSLSVQADKRLKGSKKPVNDIFDNMIRWTQYAINRGVRNRSALSLIDTATEVGLAQQVKGPKDGDNVVRVWRDGKEEYHSMADPMFVSAFRGLESVAIPTVKFFSKFADILRQSVVLYPLFGLAQVPQDSFAAMFSSGLKPQYALRIPVLAAIEFVQTLRGKSKAHEDLKNIGAAGVRDFTSSVIRNEFEIMSGLKADKSLWGAVKRGLGNVAMAADNAVRQATYEAALSQGLSQAEAMEKAFEIFNVRRRGNSKALAIAGQVIPFFNAYLAAQHVAYRTLTGVGTSPTQREAAFKTLAATTGSVMALSILYAMMMGDDEGYEKKATPTRDRMLIIPGTNGSGIPLRADLFALPKVLAEHTYHLLTENGMTDGAKFRESMKSLLANAVFSPTPVPQAVKPLAEIIFNYDFFQQRPLVGVFQQQKDLSRQFEDSTSEFSKVLGKSEMISPIMADHFIRGMFGSFGGLFLYMTNPMLAAMAGTTRPSVSMQDAIATIPNASAFVSKEYEVGLRKDFYALKEVTDRAAATLSDLKNRSPQEIADYLEDPKVQQRIALSPAVNRIANQLTQIRKQINFLTSAEAPSLTSSEKENQIRQLREAEYQLLKNINLRKLREMAQV